jgi:hypothetical protein
MENCEPETVRLPSSSATNSTAKQQGYKLDSDAWYLIT